MRTWYINSVADGSGSGSLRTRKSVVSELFILRRAEYLVHGIPRCRPSPAPLKSVAGCCSSSPSLLSSRPPPSPFSSLPTSHELLAFRTSTQDHFISSLHRLSILVVLFSRTHWTYELAPFAFSLIYFTYLVVSLKFENLLVLLVVDFAYECVLQHPQL